MNYSCVYEKILREGANNSLLFQEKRQTAHTGAQKLGTNIGKFILTASIHWN